MSERVFLDTNVLVYVFDGDSQAKQAEAQRLLRSAATRGQACISTQVLQEFYVVTTRKLARPLSHDEAARALIGFAALPVVQVDAKSVMAAVARSGRQSISLWDAMIVQAAIESGCHAILTEDLQHGQEMDGVTIVNPFRELGA